MARRLQHGVRGNLIKPARAYLSAKLLGGVSGCACGSVRPRLGHRVVDVRGG